VALKVAFDPQSPILDDEALYRSVPVGKSFVTLTREGCQLSSMAFADRARQSSVDRAPCYEYKPERAKMSETDGVAEISAGKIRTILINDYRVDVTADPRLDDNPPRPCHALIKIAVDEVTRSGFRRLCERLADMATIIIEPAECR
jgi:hypothetical protein